MLSRTLHSALVFIALVLSPQLRFVSPPELEAVQKRLESIDPQRFADVTQLVGLTDFGAPIQVELAPETAAAAQGVSPWIAGFAESASSMVVLFPARTPSYPHSSLEDVLRHEVAHVLIGRASAERRVPRWFNEGLAMSAERGRRFEDEGQLAYQLVIGSRVSLNDLDRMFGGGESDQTRAYALAGALVHDLLQRHGKSTAAEILAGMRSGASFDQAFTDAVGQSPAAADSEFWDRQRLWTGWIPIVSSSTTLWLVITALALLAIVRRRARNRAIEKQWEEEEMEERLEEEKDAGDDDVS